MECRLMVLVFLCYETTCQRAPEQGAMEGKTTHMRESKSEVKCSWKEPNKEVSCTYGARSVTSNNSPCCYVTPPSSNDCTKLTIEVCFCQPHGNTTCWEVVLLQTGSPGRKAEQTSRKNACSCQDLDCTDNCRCKVPVLKCSNDTDDNGSGLDYGVTSTDLVTTTKATTTTDTHGGTSGQFIGIGVGIGCLSLITLTILVVLCRGQRRERSHNHGVNWDDQGYMGVEIKRRPLQRQADVTGHVRTGGFNNQTYEDEIAVGIRGRSNRTIIPVVPPVPASPGGVRLTREGYVEYNPKTEQGEKSHVASGGLKHQERPLPAPHTAGSYEEPYEEINDLFTSAHSAELPTFSTPPRQVGSTGHNTPIQASVDRSRSTGYVDVDYPDLVFETTHGSDGKDPRPVGKTTPNEKASVDGSRSTGFVDVDYPDPAFETTHGSDGKDPRPVGETTPNEKCDGHRAEESAVPIYFILEQPSNEPKSTDSENPAQSGGASGRDGPENPGVSFEVVTEADGKSQSKATMNRAPSPVTGLTEPRKMDKRQPRSLTSAYNKLERGPLWRKVTK